MHLSSVLFYGLGLKRSHSANVENALKQALSCLINCTKTGHRYLGTVVVRGSDMQLIELDRLRLGLGRGERVCSEELSGAV